MTDDSHPVVEATAAHSPTTDAFALVVCDWRYLMAEGEATAAHSPTTDACALVD